MNESDFPCPTCGQRGLHYCTGSPFVTPSAVWMTPPYDRIAAAMERIADTLEQAEKRREP